MFSIHADINHRDCACQLVKCVEFYSLTDSVFFLNIRLLVHWKRIRDLTSAITHLHTRYRFKYEKLNTTASFRSYFDL